MIEDDGATMVQITSIDQGRVTGAMMTVTSDDDGKSKAFKVPLTGTFEGGAFNLSVENGIGVSLVTGVLEGDKLRLTFFGKGESQQVIFVKSDASEFDKQVDASRVRAAQKRQDIEVAAAQQERMEQRSKLQKAIDGFADELLAKAEEVQEKTKRINVVVAGYRATYERVGKMQAAKRGIDANSYDGSYRVIAIDYKIESLSNEIDMMHDSVQSYADSLSRFMAETAAQSPSFIAECEADDLLNCSRFSAASKLLQTRNQEFHTAYSREKAVFEGKRGTTS